MWSRDRLRVALIAVGLGVLGGCNDAQLAGPIPYRDSERMAKDLADKPKLQATIRRTLADLYGPDVRHLKVPKDSGLRDGGIYLADQIRVGDKLEPVLAPAGATLPAQADKPGIFGALASSPAATGPVPIEGGYRLYRRHCLHCHGVFGAGDGPTAAMLYPRPRDYRPGIYKFTSTNPVNAKPSRADLRKTLLYGLHGTSMPGFEALMTPDEIEQVIDYMTFLSIRGETERYLIDLAMEADDKDADAALEPDTVAEVVAKVTNSWKEAEAGVVNPSTRRVAATQASILRGRDFFRGTNAEGNKVECASCHGAGGKGDGPAFIEKAIFNDVQFREWPLDQAIARFYRAERDRTAAHDATHAEARPDPDGVGKFLAENPPIVTLLREKRGLMAETPAKAFAEVMQADPAKVAAEARKLLPELDEPEFRTLLPAKVDLWAKSLDAWDNPLRPANLIEGTYKGGRRPVDLYWRLAKGINGAKMPAHAPSLLTDDQIWDIVNFILAVGDDPALLDPPAAAPEPAAKVAASPELH